MKAKKIVALLLASAMTISLMACGGGGTPGAGVSSFNGRTGVVVPQKGDYTAAQVGAATMQQVNAAIQAAILASWEASY